MQDAERMKVAEARHQFECHNSRVLYDSINMLKVLERLLQENLKEKTVKILDTEMEKRLEIMKQLLQITRIENLRSQDFNCKNLELEIENEIHNQFCSNIQQNNVNEDSCVWHLPIEGESNQSSNDKNDDSAMVTDEFVSIPSEAHKDDPDVDIIPSMTFEDIVAARLVLLDEVKSKNSVDEGIVEENFEQGVAQERSDSFDVKMGSSSSSKISIAGNTKVVFKLAQAPQPKKALATLPSQRPQADLSRLEPEWLQKFVGRTFFEPCLEHPIRRNELNKYCIDCDASLCQYCVTLASHSNHRLLKIYRHVYKDVVPLDEIERHIDCSQIQPYRCNRQMVIALYPLPHTGSKVNEDTTCLTCKRKLIEYDVYSYCSISCKAEACVKRQNELAPPFLLLNQVQQVGNQEAPIPKNSRKRKGTPHRSPLF